MLLPSVGPTGSPVELVRSVTWLVWGVSTLVWGGAVLLTGSSVVLVLLFESDGEGDFVLAELQSVVAHLIAIVPSH